MRNDVREVVEQYRDMFAMPLQPLTAEHPIWVMWWQGEEQMPPIIRRCYQSLLKNGNGHPIRLITKENYDRYIELPPYIQDHFKNNQITITHLSDIIRCALLARYGGLWIDATYWVTQPIDINGWDFYSLKQDAQIALISGCRWAVNLLGGDKSFSFFPFLRDCLYSYWQKNDALVDYFILDYVIAIAYDEFPAVRQEIDDMPFRSPRLHIMKDIFENPYDPCEMEKILQENPFLKTTWKRHFNTHTPTGETTFFGYFMGQ